MEEKLKINNLIPEKSLAEALGISKATLAKFRSEGCPWLSLAGKVFFHEAEFMGWILETKKRVSDA